MTEIIKETVTTKDSGVKVVLPNSNEVEATEYQTIEYLIYFFFGVVETLLGFRFVLKLMGASLLSGFVTFIYGITGIFILPFEGIFRRGFSEGLETTSVIEPATVVAVIVYIIVAWGIVRLLRIFSGEKQQE